MLPPYEAHSHTQSCTYTEGVEENNFLSTPSLRCHFVINQLKPVILPSSIVLTMTSFVAHISSLLHGNQSNQPTLLWPAGEKWMIRICKWHIVFNRLLFYIQLRGQDEESPLCLITYSPSHFTWHINLALQLTWSLPACYYLIYFLSEEQVQETPALSFSSKICTGTIKPWWPDWLHKPIGKIRCIKGSYTITLLTLLSK